MTRTSEITLQALVAAIFVSSMFFFSPAVSHAEEQTANDPRGNAFLLSYFIKGSFGTVSNIAVPGIMSLEECNRLGAERSAVDQSITHSRPNLSRWNNIPARQFPPGASRTKKQQNCKRRTILKPVWCVLSACGIRRHRRHRIGDDVIEVAAKHKSM